MSQSCRPNWGLRANAVGLACLFISGCEGPVREPVTGPEPNALARVAGDQDERPFYHHMGEQIFLEVDPSRIVVSAPQLSGADVLEVLGREGLTALSDSPIGGLSVTHRLVQLQGGQSAAAVKAAVDRLRTSGRFVFVSNTYRLASNGSPIVPLNRLGSDSAVLMEE